MLSFIPQIGSPRPWEGSQRWMGMTETAPAGAVLPSLPGSTKAGSRARDELCIPAASEELGARSRSRSLKPAARHRAPQSVRSPRTNTHPYNSTSPPGSRGLPFPAAGSPKPLVSQSGEMCVTPQGRLPVPPVHSQDLAPYQRAVALQLLCGHPSSRQPGEHRSCWRCASGSKGWYNQGQYRCRGYRCCWVKAAGDAETVLEGKRHSPGREGRK
ncbi:hypothetical protein ASZ78_001612 [Callipepla squamata]|uniref:Uncharacterized protein n=1 Tax=Callipepla squamata TaxID=9009 RepID=A0A226NCI0_CALSU|nr:hypothetical protein ASZ78_001612 [Callipepla squamata]